MMAKNDYTDDHRRPGRPATPAAATSAGHVGVPAGAASTAAGPASAAGHVPAASGRVADPVVELRFLYDLLRLVTTARTWEELLETVVDGTRDSLGASVSSLYLLDRDGAQLTLAATNGLDRYQIGRAVVPMGEGITGRVAASRTAMVIPDVRADSRFLWVRGIDQRRFIASMLSVPLTWHDQVVGVLNVQTETQRTFDAADVDHLSAIADLLAGIVEKGRLQREAEVQVARLKALDQARNELIALVTHELRTPLAVVRAYTDLLADEPPLVGRASRDPSRRATRAAWHRGTLEQIERLDRLVDSILESVRIVPDQPPELQAIDLQVMIGELVDAVEPMLHRHRATVTESRRLHVVADRGRLRQVLEHLLENAVKYAPPDSTIGIEWVLVEGVVRLSVTDEGPGIPPEWRDRIFEPYARRETSTARGSGIGLYAARRLAESMGARLWCEPAPAGGARFVLALPAAVAV
jgi:signal transduction histidine kinase